MIKGKRITKGGLKPIIDFNILVDTDFGLASTIRREYLDSRVFSIDWFNEHKTIRSLVKELYYREHQNPLTLFANEGINIEELNSLYDQFMEDEEVYKKIIERSITTEMFNVAEKFEKESEIDMEILCFDEHQVDFLNRFDETKNCRKVLIFDVGEDLKKAEQLFFKNIDDKNLENICVDVVGKTVYFGAYKYNYYDMKNINYNERQRYILTELLSKGCQINFVDVYSKIILEGALEET